MDDYRIVSAVSKDTHLEECPTDRRTNHHAQVVVHLDSADCVTDRVLHVGIGDVVDSSGLANPHADNVPCLSNQFKQRATRPRLRPLGLPGLMDPSPSFGADIRRL
jgi:hypothetical protein